MMPEESPRDGDRRHALVTRLYKWHATAYGVLMGGLAIVNMVVGGGWWSFWPKSRSCVAESSPRTSPSRLAPTSSGG